MKVKVKVKYWWEWYNVQPPQILNINDILLYTKRHLPNVKIKESKRLGSPMWVEYEKWSIIHINPQHKLTRVMIWHEYAHTINNKNIKFNTVKEFQIEAEYRAFKYMFQYMPQDTPLIKEGIGNFFFDNCKKGGPHYIAAEKLLTEPEILQFFNRYYNVNYLLDCRKQWIDKTNEL